MTAPAQARETFEVVNPATGDSVGTFPVHDEAAVRDRVDQARRAQTAWAELGFAGRREYLRRWMRWLARNCDELYEVGHQETARPRADVQFELFAGLEDIRWAAANAKRVLGPSRRSPGLAMFNFTASVSYRPLGVIGVIAPWNVPIYTAASGIGYALAAGNAAVVKPSELSAASGIYVAESFATANPDAPPGLVQWITGLGATGAALCTSGADKIFFTGSVPTGRRVMAACAQNLTPVLLELGGKDATVIAADADLDAAATAVAWGGLFNGGQACVGVERVYVEAPVRDAFLDRLKRRMGEIEVGTGPLSAYGPMTVPAQVEIVRRHVDEALAAGAQALVGGPESIRPPYVDPVVLVDVPEDCSAVQEETFGPVVVVNTVPSVEEGVRRANATVFGLGSSVFSRRQGPAIADRLRAGGTTINSVLSFVGMSSVPFGGVGDSGFGRSHGDDGLREFSYAKSTVRKRFSLGPDMQAFPRTPEQFDQVRKTIRLRYGRTFH
jgi:succinate-semialdehyde dehydrogenase / glutarate-semialdehyde dehydrogenase